MAIPFRVLIVEDSVEDTELLLEELRLGGYDPTYEQVQTAKAMTAALNRQSWDIVFCDYTMPQFSGMDALSLIRERDLNLPFIFLSGTIGEDIAVTAMKLGAHDYIMKDNLKRLLPAVERELGEAENRRERNRVEEQLRQSETRFHQITENINEVFWITNPDKNEMLYISPGYEKIWGRTCESLYERSTLWMDAIHPEDRNRVLKWALENQVQGIYDEQYRIIRPDGAVRWIRDRAFPIKDATGRVYRITGIAEDITERKQAEELIQHMAFYDALTDLPNRNLFHDRLLHAIRTDSGEGSPMALLLMDLDHFKEINDTLGHQRGDLLLTEMGKRLKSALFEPDIFARLGGDEFAILLPKLAKVEDIYVVIRKIQNALRLPFMIEDIPVAMEASIGVALYPDHGENPDSLLQRADVAMYKAKRAGSSYAIYDTKQDEHSPRRLALIGELRQAIEKDQLFLHYQPKINFKTGRVIGTEALVRWQHPRYGFVPPDQFILPAEQTGLIHPLTRWVLKTALRQSQDWHRAGLKLPVSVNLSARNLHDPKLPDYLAELLNTSGGRPELLELEITESAIMADSQRALEVITSMKAMGLRFALDDFGIGYSSLAYLKKLPVDSIKIDKSFVIDMMRDEDDVVIVFSTINLAHNLGLEVVAEGVETKEIWDRLSASGCDAAQGYYMARPMPATDLTHWLKESPWGLK